MTRLTCDVLVIGGGAAGIRAAIAAKRKGIDVMLISKASAGYSMARGRYPQKIAGTYSNLK